MKAMIFAAGLGTRLLPITEKMPKALVEIHGIPLLEMAIRKLTEAGFNEIIVNTHHFPDQIRDFLSNKNFPEVHIDISDETGELLETGGGLKKASWFFDDDKPFLLYNVDVLIDFNLKDLYRTHLEMKPLATLAVSNRDTSRYLMFDRQGMMKGWMNLKSGETKPAGVDLSTLQRFAFSGIHVCSPRLLTLLKDEGKFSLIESYIDLCKDHPVRRWEHDPADWIDVGKPEVLNSIHTKPMEKLFHHD
jgi:NDP-sugar pyrophosphorylase family protein